MAVTKRAWSTEGVPEAERLSLWQGVASDAWAPVTLSHAAAGTFSSRVESRSVGALSVAQLESCPQVVRRTDADIRSRAGDSYFVNLPLDGGTYATQDGRTAVLARGDFVVVDAAQPFTLGFDRPFRQVSLTVPHEMLAPLLCDPGRVTATRVRGDAGVGAVASATIRALALPNVAMDAATARALTAHVTGMLALALGGVRDGGAAASPALLTQAALDEVERSLADPDLSPALVADRLAISVRYLHHLFSERGPSFKRWVLARRLERSRLDLLDPERAHWPVAAVATANGFADPSYFARAFRARYGVSPREMRTSAHR